ncbi:MAG: DHH family phosphoesterase [Phycisphaerae bacterium]|nr:DHH family phosphoesterase [Phycisphaerae bacterium]
MKRPERLLQILDEYAQVAIITHDNPDPDAIASGWAMLTLVKERLRKPVRVLAGGAIVRAENVCMVKLLQPPIELVDTYSPEDDTAPVLVDCLPEAANHLLGHGAARVVAVIDHHDHDRARVRVRHSDIRPRASASATIAAAYLREQNIEPSTGLATALLYAVRTETIGTYLPFARWERGVVAWLAERADHRVVANIEEAPLTRGYFEDLILALGSTFLYEGVAVCFLPQAHCAEIVGEVADLLIRCTEVDRVLCAAIVGRDLVFSSRTGRDAGDAVRLLGRTLEGIGHWGGHPHRAGGKIAGDGGREITEDLLDQLKTRWLAACGVENGRCSRLITRRELRAIL